MGDTKAARLASEIEAWIERDRPPTGTFLGKKSSLAADHGVSVQTVNEALRLLQERGLISVKPGPGGGVSVAASAERATLSKSLLAAQDDPRRLGELFTVQDALQEVVCAEAAASCTPEAAERILAAAARLDAASDASERLLAIWDVDRQIAHALRDTVLETVYVLILDMISTSMQRWPLADEVSPGTIAVHREMARAVASNQVAAARSAARLHSPLRSEAAAGAGA